MLTTLASSGFEISVRYIQCCDAKNRITHPVRLQSGFPQTSVSPVAFPNALKLRVLQNVVSQRLALTRHSETKFLILSHAGC